MSDIGPMEMMANLFGMGTSGEETMPIMHAELPTPDDMRRAELALHSQVQVAHGRSDSELAESLSKVMGWLASVRTTIEALMPPASDLAAEPQEGATEPPSADAASGVGAPESGAQPFGGPGNE